ncbi:TOG array regulator of axonemal microtubules protein 1 isoform X7 [Molossus molossus]|uniref:TOG array regulator of axonemal microtubules protein 1 isoform X7 n=1 Tax=Molossus molossus TaxID=27622 RepID=UPI001745D69E|nr:TOG array regulator of axonemal microtubules protein 1 isoform X7 [Molossus molossus]
MRGEKNCCRGAAGDHGSCPPTPSPLASTLLMPAEAISSSWSGSGGGLSGGDEEETRLLQQLRTAPDPSEAFQALQAVLPRRGSRLGFPRRKEALYRALGRVLVEGGGDEKRLCLQLLSDILRVQGEAGQLEEAFSLALLPQLVVSLREENPALRKDALQILHICLKRSSGQVLRTLIQQGLESADARLRASTALLFPILLTPEDLLLSLDLTEVIISLARKLGDQETEESETAFSALQQIGERLGHEKFQSYISRLPSALRRHYNRRLESQFGSQVPYYLELEASGFPENTLPCAVTVSNSNLKFGIIPQELHSRLLDQEDYKNRTQAVEELKQFSAYDFIPSSKLKPSQGMSVNNDDLCFSRKRMSRNLFQNSRDFNSDSLPVCAAGTTGTQTNLSGKCGQLGFSHICSKTGSVDSDLQYLGTTNSHQDKVYASLNFGSKTQQTFGSQTEHTSSYSDPNPNPGAFILPSYPLSSPRTSPKHISLTVSPKKSQDNCVNFSNSWPLKSFEGLSKPSSQKKFVSQKSSGSTGKNDGESSQENPPVQLRPALVRSPSSRRGLNGNKPVPPIPRGVNLLPDKANLSTVGPKKKEPHDIWKSENDNLKIDLSELNIKDNDLDQEEMQSSLRSLRNSAAKKRAKLSGSTSDLESPDSAIKLDLTMDSPSRSSSPNISSYSESGVYSQESLTSSLSTTPQGKTIMSDVLPTFGSKPCLIRLSSTKKKIFQVAEQSPSTGITSSSVRIIGQRMNYGFGCGDFEDDRSHDISSSVLKIQNKEQSRHKHTKGFTGSSSNLQQISSFDFSSTNTLSEDSVVVVGKGVFGSPNSAPATYSQSVISSVENGCKFLVKQSIEPPPGIYGRAVQQSIPSYLNAEDEKDIKISVSKSTFDKMKQKRKEEKELLDIKDSEKKEQNPWEQTKHTGTEKMASENLNIFGDEVGISKHESSSLENITYNPPLKGGASLRRSPSSVFSDSGEASPGAFPQYKERIPSVTHSPEIMDSSELRPFSKPDVVLIEALKLLADEDWEKKIEGLNFIRCLAAFHSEILNTKLHETNFAVVQEVKNLRSGVSRAAVVCLSDLFTYLKKSMDQELDTAVKVLLHKAGESNTFIREDVDKALRAMVRNVTPARAVVSLINGGQSHLHIAVRRCTAQHLSDVVELMEVERILSGTKDMADRILPAAAKFAQDSSQETRYYGRKMLFLMMCHPNFDKMLEKYVPSKDLPYIKESVKSLRHKGLGDLPLDTPSAKGRRSHTGSIGNTKSSSVSRDVFNSGERKLITRLNLPFFHFRKVTEISEVTRKSVPRNSLESAEYIKVITGLLNAKDFRDRINGIKQLLSDTENNQELVVGNIVKIFDAFKSRLHDSNSKVNLVALETMHKMIPLLRDNLSPIINMLIPAIVDNNLNSKNPGIYAAATDVVQALSQHVDNYLLLQPFCTKAQFLNGKAKQDMTEKLADIVMELYQRKPHATEQKVLVVLWHLLGNMTNSGSLPGAGGNIRRATAKLSKALFAQMGQNLLNQAASQPPHIKKSLEELLNMTI